MTQQEQGNTCVVGLQWGDEGKGKVVDVLMERHDVVVRYAGGANAGHTVVVNGEKFALHQAPSGVLRENVACLLASGMVIDPAVLLSELKMLRERGVDVTDRLMISNRAHLVMPYHRREDAFAEARYANGKLGTTARGIGPCYADKVLRYHGLRVGDLLRPDRFREKVAKAAAYKNSLFAAIYEDRDPLESDAIAEEYLAFAEELAPLIGDTVAALHQHLSAGRRVLFEGAQGSLLDLDHGTYPFVTSSNASIGGVSSGAGASPRVISDIVGVLKAYSTRVGAGPFPTELHGDDAERIRERGNEYGTTTGRARRCGWLDLVAARYAAQLSGPTHLAVLHLDTLAGLPELRLCVAYRLNGEVLAQFPADADDLEAAEPIYETIEGWDADLGACRKLRDLPTQARAYLDVVSSRVGVPLGLVGVGPGREQTIFVEE